MGCVAGGGGDGVFYAASRLPRAAGAGQQARKEPGNWGAEDDTRRVMMKVKSILARAISSSDVTLVPPSGVKWSSWPKLHISPYILFFGGL